MTLPKQLINLLGFVIVIAVLAIGGALVAAPLYTQSLSIDGDTARVAQTNAQYSAQVQSLSAAKKRLATTEKDVAALRAELTSAPDRDDVFELVTKAAAHADATVTTVTAGDVVPFAARASVGDDGAAAPAPETNADATTDASTDAAAAASTTTGASATAPPAPADDRQQASFTITVDVPSPAKAAQFLDGLRAGPRLVAITHSALSESSGGADETAAAYQLTVDALAFISPAQ
jgi:hypothetical protein